MLGITGYKSHAEYMGKLSLADVRVHEAGAVRSEVNSTFCYDYIATALDLHEVPWKIWEISSCAQLAVDAAMTRVDVSRCTLESNRMHHKGTRLTHVQGQ